MYTIVLHTRLEHVAQETLSALLRALRPWFKLLSKEVENQGDVFVLKLRRFRKQREGDVYLTPMEWVHVHKIINGVLDGINLPSSAWSTPYGARGRYYTRRLGLGRRIKFTRLDSHKEEWDAHCSD